MSKKDFTGKEAKILSQNKYINSVTTKKLPTLMNLNVY